MNPVPLDQIGFNWISHKSALWWLGLLYRRHAKIEIGLKSVSRFEGLRIGSMLWFHSLPYIGAICVLARFVMFNLLDLHRNPIAPGHANELLFHFYAIVGGIVMGMVLGMAIGIAFGIAKGIAFG